MERTASQDSQDRSFATMGILLSSNSAITAVLNPFGSILNSQSSKYDMLDGSTSRTKCMVISREKVTSIDGRRSIVRMKTEKLKNTIVRGHDKNHKK